MVLPELVGPVRKLAFEFAQHIQPRFKFHLVALAVVKGNGFDTLVLAERMRQTGG